MKGIISVRWYEYNPENRDRIYKEKIYENTDCNMELAEQLYNEKKYSKTHGMPNSDLELVIVLSPERFICQKCGSEYEFNKFCGAWVCPKCHDHKGLGRCFCGWKYNPYDDPVGDHIEGWNEEDQERYDYEYENDL